MHLFELVAEASPGWSLIYSDYEVETDGVVEEVHLLDHHAGRVRESTDYGAVWLINREALRDALTLGTGVRQHALYDLRLRLSESGDVIYIASRYSGGAYTVSKTRQERIE